MVEAYRAYRRAEDDLASAGLGHRHPLDPVCPALELEPGPRALALHQEADLLQAAQGM